MKILKGLAISLLSFVLFLCLWVFGIIFSLNATVLDRNFMVAEVNKLDTLALTKDLANMFTGQLTQDYQFLKQPVTSAFTEFAPSLKQQMSAATESAYDYLLGKTNQLSITISFDSLKTSLRDKAYQAFQQNLPAQLASQPQQVKDQYFNQLYQQYSQQLPPTIPITESTLGPDVMNQVRLARQYFGYIQIAFWGLIALMVLLVAAIILIDRDVKKVTRSLGVNFLIYGIVGFVTMIAGRLLLGQYVTPMLSSFAGSSFMPQSIVTWLTQVGADISALTSLQMFSIALLAVGIVLIIVSFVYRPQRAKADNP